MHGTVVSIISVWYNRDELVMESIASLLNQTYESIEIIVIDDGSTDNTLEVLNSIKDPRLRVYGQPNCGFVKSIRRGIDLSNSDFIAIHGSGDISYPERIEMQMQFLTENEQIGVVGNWIEVLDTRSQVTFYKRPRPCIERRGSKVIGRIPVYHGSAMFRKNVYERVGGYREFFKYAQDRDLWLRMSMVTKIGIIPRVLYKQYILADSVTGMPKKELLQAYLSDFAVQCQNKRCTDGFDYLDDFGVYGIFFRKRSKALSKLLWQRAFIRIAERDYEVATMLNQASLHERISVPNIALQMVLRMRGSKLLMGVILALFSVFERRRRRYRQQRADVE